MATKKCINGHLYDATIYGDHCPFCPPSEQKTKVASESFDDDGGHTRPVAGYGQELPTAPTMPASEPVEGEAGTIIRRPGGANEQNVGTSNRQLVGVVVSFTHNPLGEVFNLYEGKNLIGRSSKDCNITFSKDSNMSGTHLLILYREAEGKYWAVDQNSSNGTYINGEFVGDRKELKSNDVIVIGGTKLMFVAIPNF